MWSECNYVELHMHSNYSLLEGASSIDELLRQAVEFNYDAIALTDHNALFGAMEFAQKARRYGIKPIIGLELNVRGDPVNKLSAMNIHHVTLLAENERGYANLCRLSSMAFGLFEGSPDARENKRLNPSVSPEELCQHAEGLILLTGCTEGLIARYMAAGQSILASNVLEYWLASFGTQNVFMEISDNLISGQRLLNHSLLRLAIQFNISAVATGNVHYHIPDRYRLQDVLVAISQNVTIDDSEGIRRPNGEFYLRSPSEQFNRFSVYGNDLVKNTVEIASRCQFDLTEDLGYSLPIPPIPNNRDPHTYLTKLCFEKLATKYGSSKHFAEARERLLEELRLINKHGLTGFFLIYVDIYELASEVASEIRSSRGVYAQKLPVGRGRGSSVASVVCYLIGLSHIDPVENKLFLGRFLNDELYSLPDIDLDFPRDIRALLISRIYDRWGIEHAALVATFSRYRRRSAIRDVGNALGLPKNLLARLIKQSKFISDISELFEYIGLSDEIAADQSLDRWHLLIDLVQQILDFPRHLSQHPGGMVISSRPLTNYVPCQPAAWAGRYQCHWDKDSIEDARMVKIDLLGLGMLSVVEDAIELIGSNVNPDIDLSRINFDDTNVYDSICSGDTIGVFQIESRAQIAMLPRTRPKNLGDLAVQVSIVRPGPIVGGAVNPYIKRREEQLASPEYIPPYPHPALKDVLSETLGVVIFQEQVIQVAQIIADFTAGEADAFRRTLGRKSASAEIELYREHFLAHAQQKDIPLHDAENIFKNLVGFAEFGFPKSHGTAFALLAYQTAWLKYYYPSEFICSLFNNQPMGFYPSHVLTNDAKRHGVSIKRPDINLSTARCQVDYGSQDNSIILGLGYVEDVGLDVAKKIILEREKAGVYKTLFEFIQRTAVPVTTVINLIMVGAFDEFGLNRRELIWHAGLFKDIPSILKNHKTESSDHQLQLALDRHQDQIELNDFNSFEKMTLDYKLLKLSPDSHPMKFFRKEIDQELLSSRDLKDAPADKIIKTAGLMVCRQRPSTAKGIVFLLLEDEYGVVNVLLSPKLVEKNVLTVNTASFVQVTGYMDGAGAPSRTLVAQSIEPIAPHQLSTANQLSFKTKSWG